MVLNMKIRNFKTLNIPSKRRTLHCSIPSFQLSYAILIPQKFLFGIVGKSNETYMVLCSGLRIMCLLPTCLLFPPYLVDSNTGKISSSFFYLKIILELIWINLELFRIYFELLWTILNYFELLINYLELLLWTILNSLKY